MKTLLLCLLFVNSTLATPGVDWYEGVIVLADETVLTGMLAVDTRHHFVLYKKAEGGADFYPASRVRETFYYDFDADLNRHFQAFSLRSDNVITTRLYEVVVGGSIRVLRLAKDQPSVTTVPDRDNYEYIVQYGSDLIPLRKIRGSFFKQLSENLPSLRTFIKEEHLSLYEDADLIAIVQYVNRSWGAESVLSVN